MNELMTERTHATPQGKITYWVTSKPDPASLWLIFLPGLTADHRLFDEQVDHFCDKANILVWDAPSHGLSRPFALDWSLDDKARWLGEILQKEGITDPVICGQSMGGYVAQAFMDLYPKNVRGFISIDSCPLQRSYYQSWEIAALKHTKLMFSLFPWKTLVNLGAKNNSTTPYGHELMRQMMLDYQKDEYCALSAHGFRVLAEAVEAARPYEIACPRLIICGEKDNAGSARRYNAEWEKRTGIPVSWIPDAGHNSNCDAPAIVNAAIERFIADL